MPRSLLIIDDDDDIREVAAMSLEALGGWEVSVAASGAEGVLAARSGTPDAVLLDVMMPGMDGPTTLRELRDDPLTASIPVIFCTAKVQRNDRSHLLGLGAAGVLEKPFDPMILHEDVDRVLTPKQGGTA